MGEEGKKKKLKYEQPRLVKLSGAAGAGDCRTGSGDAGCYAGNVAGSVCATGNTAAGFGCNSGNTAGVCATGSGGGAP